MTTLGQLPPERIVALVENGDLLLHVAPYTARIQSSEPLLARDLGLLYADFEVLAPDRFADFHVSVMREVGLRRWLRPLIRFHFDGVPSFMPLLATHATASFEWGLNWCVASHSHQFLVIHAAVIERHGVAVLMPAPPGSGKSTLCAALVQSGWRLLSDELGLYDPGTGQVFGMARPINLKNRSIDVIRPLVPAGAMTAPVANTSKGTVALLRPPTESVKRAREGAVPRAIVVPRFEPGSATLLSHFDRAHVTMLIAEQSFNYDVLGVRGFEAVTALVDACRCHEFMYSDLGEARDAFDDLAEQLRP